MKHPLPWWHSEKWFVTSTYGKEWTNDMFWYQEVLGFNRHVPWPCSPLVTIYHPDSIRFHPTSLVVFQSPGCCFHAAEQTRIVIGKNVRFGPGVGLITCDHDYTDPTLDRLCNFGDIVIGDSSWVCMNAVICPGVELKPRTVVGANSVVKESPDVGNVVIAGAPARVVKEIQ